jgi:trigger factor
MQVTVEEVGSLSRKLKIVLPKEEVSRELDAGFNKVKSNARIKGFRRGKVPRHILERTYGQQVRAEVAGKDIWPAGAGRGCREAGSGNLL